MEMYKKEFIEFMVRSGVLLFGDFVTKSGRRTPFFINTGKYETGRQMATLGRFYARALHRHLGGDMDILFGPAYKGIPLVVTASIALAENFDTDVSFAFNRKEAKDHGEKGTLVGRVPRNGDRVVIVEDVTTAGTSIRESITLLRAVADVRFSGVIVSVDRMERGSGETSALQELRDTFGIQVFPIVTLDEVVEHLHNREIDGHVVVDSSIRDRITAYRERYGVR